VISGNKEKNHSNGQNIHHTGFLGGLSTVFVEITLFDNGGSGTLVGVGMGVVRLFSFSILNLFAIFILDKEHT
jgi:hypothetical protein